MPKLQSILTVIEGDVFAVRLENGLYAACRVIWDTTSDANKRHKKKYDARDAVRMVCCNWFGEKLPNPGLPELREVLKLTHHSWKNKPLAGWCQDDVPSDVIHIGVIPRNESENRLGANDSLDWGYLRLQALMQWEWDQDGEAVLAREKAEEERLAREYEEHESTRRKELTLDKLAEHRFLTDWESPIPKGVIQRSRKLLRDTARELAALGANPTIKERLSVLQTCIEQFNALDAKHSFIGTIEREDICDEFDLLVHACGLTRRKNLADKWRDW